MAISRRFLLRVAVVITTPLLSAQIAPPNPSQKAPLIRLEIVPASKTYMVGEVIVVKYKLTNVSDVTVCFPRPDTKTEDESEGYVQTHATDSQGKIDDLFIEGFYPRGMNDLELVNEANEKWIKVSPGLSYVTEEARPLGSLAPGDWKLQSKYSPPYLRGRGSLISDALSCTPPRVGALSKPVNVRVVTSLASQ